MQRIDKWLWCARFAKSRTLAAGLVSDGRVRVNGERCIKPAYTLKPGDVLSIAHGPMVRVVRMLAPAERRGPAPEAQLLYTDIAPFAGASGGSEEAKAASVDAGGPAAPIRERGTGRPTKKDRRALNAMRASSFPDG